jgi:hypothetical protein
MIHRLVKLNPNLSNGRINIILPIFRRSFDHFGRRSCEANAREQENAARDPQVKVAATRYVPGGTDPIGRLFMAVVRRRIAA